MSARDSTSSDASNPDALLVRGLGVRQLAANIFNYTVGSGIFVLPGLAVAQLGPAAPLAYFVCAIVIGLVVLCFAEAGSRVAATGGPYAYVEAALGSTVGFMAGMLVLLTGVSAAAAVASVFVRSLLTVMPHAPQWTASALVVITVATLVAINVRGLKTGARLLEVVTLGKLLPLVLFVAVGVFFIDPAHLRWEATPSTSQVLSTAGVVIFAFSGIEGSLIPSGEVRSPSRSVPRAAFIALSVATLLYLAIQFVALGVLGPALGTERTAPLAKAAAAIAGTPGHHVMIAAAAISMFGYLSANVLSEPRALFAFARDGLLPPFFARVHARFHTPATAIVVYGILVTALALSGTFEQLAVFANLAALLLYFTYAIAAWRLRVLDVRADGPPFVTPGGVTLYIAAGAGIAWVFYATVEIRQLVALLGVLVLSLALYGFRAWRLARTHAA